jgi:hypothetical protein
MLEKLHIIITIAAAIVTTAVCALMGYRLTHSALLIIITIAVFYMIGSAIKIYTDAVIFPVKEEEFIPDSIQFLETDQQPEDNTGEAEA